MAEQESKKSTRRIRKVETVREITANSSNQQPSRKQQIGRGFTAPLRFVGRGFKKVGTALDRVKVFHIIGLILWPRYFRNSWKELRMVTWPTGKQARQLTLAVILFAVVFGALVAVLDFGLDKIFKQVLLK